MNEEEKVWKTLKVIHPKTRKILTKDENFSMKFGYLKKACVLYQYEWYKEAFLTIAEGAVLVKAELAQLKVIEEKNKLKWKTWLGLPPKLELPKTKEEILAEKKIDLDYIEKLDVGNNIDPAKVLTYIQMTILNEA